jgi:hypothetical protein
MEERTNVLRGVAFCARVRDLHGGRAPDSSNRCELCDEVVWVDPHVKMRHLVCAECLPRTPPEWIADELADQT